MNLYFNNKKPLEHDFFNKNSYIGLIDKCTSKLKNDNPASPLAKIYSNYDEPINQAWVRNPEHVVSPKMVLDSILKVDEPSRYGHGGYDGYNGNDNCHIRTKHAIDYEKTPKFYDSITSTCFTVRIANDAIDEGSQASSLTQHEESDDFSEDFYDRIMTFLDDNNLYIADVENFYRPPKKLMSLSKYHSTLSARPSTLDVLIAMNDKNISSSEDTSPILDKNFSRSTLFKRRQERASISITRELPCCNQESMLVMRKVDSEVVVRKDHHHRDHGDNVENCCIKGIQSIGNPLNSEENQVPLTEMMRYVGSNSLDYIRREDRLRIFGPSQENSAFETA